MNILLVDDNVDFLEMMRESLYSHGYNVYSAENGAEGCRILESPEIDLIISDIRMPEFDGIEFHRFTREHKQYKDAKFVFISGHKDEFIGSLRLKKGTDFFLEKTTPLDEVVRFIDEIMFGDYAAQWLRW